MLIGVRIEAVVTDLDGTVVRSDFSISPATLEAVVGAFHKHGAILTP